MISSQKELLASLRAAWREISDLESTLAILDWDQSTYMPPKGAPQRGRQMAFLGRLLHERRTSPALGECLAGLRRVEEQLAPEERAMLRAATRDYERAIRLPSDFVAESKEHFAASYVAWTEAKARSDFEALRPYLEKTVELSRRFSDYYPESAAFADPLIDEADPGMSHAKLLPLFERLRPALRNLSAAIQRRPAPGDAFLQGDFPMPQQRSLGESIVRALGYDFERGRQDETHHPFMTRFSSQDVRITTRFDERNLTQALFSTIHEAGHAMYEQGIAEEYDATPLGRGTSSGVHESQSRLWENMVGRSLPFWRAFYPKVQAYFPAAFGEVVLEDFHRAVNKVASSLIRTDADEVTYNLHVMIRFELASRLLSGDLRAAELPEAWAEAYGRDLGVRPADAREGCLQDVHWFAGPIGGAFQSYTLGNMMAAQFFEAAQREGAVAEALAAGEFGPLHAWLKTQVYRFGATYEPEELLKRATGTSLSTEPFLRYLRDKYLPLYGLDESAFAGAGPTPEAGKPEGPP